MPGQDSRQSERHRVRFKLIFDDGRTFNAGSVSNVSEHGAFLETAMPLPVGTLVTLTPLEQIEDILFEVKARVVRSIPYDRTSVEPAGMGVQFLDLGDTGRKDVKRMIEELEKRIAEFQGELDPFLGVLIPRSS